VITGLANTASAADARKAIVLSGKLPSQVKWGPPGFGETGDRDQRLTIFVLELRSARSARDLSLPEATGKARQYSEVQLKCDRAAVSECEKLLAHSVGHPVTIPGKTEYAVYPTDFLPVVMTVSRITGPE